MKARKREREREKEQKHRKTSNNNMARNKINSQNPKHSIKCLRRATNTEDSGKNIAWQESGISFLLARMWTFG